MQRLVDTLAEAPYRFIVSKGPQHELYGWPTTWSGEEFLPQTSVLPQVDLVITHGGNNTVTECLHFGKPMVVLPLFWDQYDNAQRVHETGFGLRLDTYGHGPEELSAAVDRLLADGALPTASPRCPRGCRPTAAPGAAGDLIEAARLPARYSGGAVPFALPPPLVVPSASFAIFIAGPAWPITWFMISLILWAPLQTVSTTR